MIQAYIYIDMDSQFSVNFVVRNVHIYIYNNYYNDIEFHQYSTLYVSYCYQIKYYTNLYSAT